MRRRRAHVPAGATTVVVALVALVVTACGGASSGTETAEGSNASHAPPAEGDANGGVDERGTQPQVEVDDGYLEVLGPDGRTLATFPPSVEEGRAVHAVVRPREGATATVLALFRVEHPQLQARYELRYLTVTDDGPSALYWFPWRLQVHAELADVRDDAPLPVWSPDGDAIAWIEWTRDDTILRIVGWHDEGGSSNPSDLVASYRLREVVPGTQLDEWRDGDGVVFLATAPDGEVLEIELTIGGLALSL